MTSRTEHCEYDSSSDDSDSDDEFDIFGSKYYQSQKQQKTASQDDVKTSSPTATTPSELPPEISRLPALTEAEKQEILEKIVVSDEDEHKQSEKTKQARGLQTVFWSLDCNYTLHKHQFEGVRAMAGVSDDFGGSPNLDANQIQELLKNAKPRRSHDHGLIMADVMGLGKTVQGVLACILRNAIADAKKEPKKPTLICSPNEAVLDQWYDTLVKAGIDKTKIKRMKTKRSKLHREDVFVLCTRYDLQTDVRYCFYRLKSVQSQMPIRRSSLFPNAAEQQLRALKNQYRADKGKEKNQHNEKNGVRISINECVTDQLARGRPNQSPTFRTVIIDEAHFLKSLKTYWGMCAGLLGLHTERMIPMTGTPFNNSLQDMATLMTFIEPSHKSAFEKWWKEKTENGAANKVVAAIKRWSDKFLVRRGKDVIAHLLKNKTIHTQSVRSYPLELSVYEEYEETFLKVLGQLFKLQTDDAASPEARRRMRECLKVMLAVAACMRFALIHPVIPGGGRDITIFFSPSRSKMPSVLKRQEKKNLCVCCKRRTKLAVRSKRERNDGDDDLLVEDMNDDDGDLFVLENEEDFVPQKVQKGTGGIVPIPSDRCPIGEKGIRHYACESCLAKLISNMETCPHCENLFKRLRCEDAVQEVQEQLSAAKEDGLFAEMETLVDQLCIPGRIYREDIFGGLRDSAKLRSIVSGFATKVPKDEKALIVSFCKGTLDILEMMFSEDHEEDLVLRFDGDIKSIEREAVLEQFKTDPRCRILLMTVQTGGTGLNLVSANHVWFVDRFWNPMVMEQCEDRCYRIGQEKDVSVVYFDSSMTIDDAMAYINKAKSTNAAVILADGPALAKEGVSFSEITGSLGQKIGALREARAYHIFKKPQNIVAKLPPTAEGVLHPESVPTRSMRSADGRIPSMTDVFVSAAKGTSEPTARESRRVPDGLSLMQMHKSGPSMANSLASPSTMAFVEVPLLDSGPVAAFDPRSAVPDGHASTATHPRGEYALGATQNNGRVNSPVIDLCGSDDE